MKQIGRYILILVSVMVLWNTILIKPLKVFTVFLHELGHALMAAIFGYGITGINVFFNESGYTLTRSKGWFSSVMIANGGYLGSVLFALLILYIKRTSLKKYELGSIAILFLAISVKFSGVITYTFLFSMLFAITVIILYMFQNEKLTDWVIDILGISSVAYAIYDTFVDTILLQLNLKLHLIGAWRGPVTDAMRLQQLTYIPAVIWGILWMAAAIFIVFSALMKAPSKSKK